MKTKLIAILFFLSLGSVVGVANAKGCVEGAAVGGLAGHVAGHHGVAGAAVGCTVGHHRATVKAKKQAAEANAPATNGSPAPQGAAPTNVPGNNAVPATK